MRTHPDGSNLAVPRRPPRLPPSPSTRSRSLELLDQQIQEQRKSPFVISAVVERPPLPRPRSRSLDGLLDEDAKNDSESCDVEQDKAQNRIEHSMTNSEENKIVSALQENQKRSNHKIVTSKNELRPIPRTKTRMSNIIKAKFETEDVRASLDEDNKQALLMRPLQFSQLGRSHSSLEEQFSINSSKQYRDQEHQIDEETRKTIQGTSLITQHEKDYKDDNDKSTIMLKTSRSCGAGLDFDGSVSSSEYGEPRIKDPGSLLSLPMSAEPKRKRNFMDKCVNKVRSFMKK